jgi:hypothetical protein
MKTEAEKKPKTERRKLTHAEKACATRASAIFESRKATQGLTQDAVAATITQIREALGNVRPNITQSGVQQYLSGSIPMNLEIKYALGKALDCQIWEIDPVIDDLAIVGQLESQLLRLFWAAERSGKETILSAAKLHHLFEKPR